MKLHILIFLILTLFSNAFCQRSKPASENYWYQLKNEFEGFAAKFPQQPKLEVNKNSIVTLNRYIYSGKGNLYFEVSHMNLPAGINDSAEAFKAADAILSANITSLKAQIISSNLIQYKNCQGKEITAVSPSNLTIRIRFFLSGQNLYTLIFGAPANTAQSRTSSKYFFESFEVIGGCSNAIAPVEAPPTEIKTKYLDGPADPVSGWKRIASPEGGFEVLAPDKIKMTEQQFIVNPYPVFLRLYQTTAQTAIYFVSVKGDFPNDYVSKSSHQAALDIVRKKMEEELLASDPTTQVTFTRNINIGEYPGREYKIKFGKRTGQAQIFSTANREYLFIASDESINYSQSNMDRFFNSIRISVK